MTNVSTMLIKYEYHFNDNTTYVFQYDGKKYCINGCQAFVESKLDEVCAEHAVGSQHILDVVEAFAELSADLTDIDDIVDICHENPKILKLIKIDDVDVLKRIIADAPNAIKFISMTDELKFFAVNENAFNIRLIRYQPVDLCLAAVRRNPAALTHIVKQYLDVCLEAARLDDLVIWAIKDPDMQQKVLNILNKESKGEIDKAMFPEISQLYHAIITNSNKPATEQFITIKQFLSKHDAVIANELERFSPTDQSTFSMVTNQSEVHILTMSNLNDDQTIQLELMSHNYGDIKSISFAS